MNYRHHIEKLIFDIKIVSTASIDPNLRNVLDLIARSTAYNRYQINQSGQLPENVTHRLF